MHLVYELVRRAPARRAELAAATALSKPTVTAALQQLEAAKLVAPSGQTLGGPGRRASIYGLVPGAAAVLAVDVATHVIRAAVVDLAGEAVAHQEVAVTEPTAGAVQAALGNVRDWAVQCGAPLVLAAVGLPGIVDPRTGRVSAVTNVNGLDGTVADRWLGDILGMPALVENDVNLAAIGELSAGAGRGADSFAYIKVGSGIGAGLVLEGKLHRGARGAAGEVGFLPVGPAPSDPRLREAGGSLEVRLAAGNVLTRAQQQQHKVGLPIFEEISAVFEAARRGDEVGRATVGEMVLDIATCVAAITSVIDIDLVLLGGGISAHADIVVDDVRRIVGQMAAVPPTIGIAQLGTRAELVGAGALGRAEAQRRLIAAAARD